MGIERNPMLAAQRMPADEKGSGKPLDATLEQALQMNAPDFFTVERLMHAGLRQKAAKRFENVMRRDFDGKTVRQFFDEYPTVFALSLIPEIGEKSVAAIVHISKTYGLPLDASRHVPPEKAVPLKRMRMRLLEKPVTASDWNAILSKQFPERYRRFLEKMRSAGDQGIKVSDLGTDDQPFTHGHLDAINEILKGHELPFRVARVGMVIGSQWPERMVHMRHAEPIESGQK